MDKNNNKIRQNAKNLNTSKTTKLSPIMSKTIPVPSGVAILSHVEKSIPRAAIDWRFMSCCGIA